MILKNIKIKKTRHEKARSARIDSAQLGPCVCFFGVGPSRMHGKCVGGSGPELKFCTLSQTASSLPPWSLVELRLRLLFGARSGRSMHSAALLANTTPCIMSIARGAGGSFVTPTACCRRPSVVVPSLFAQPSSLAPPSPADVSPAD